MHEFVVCLTESGDTVPDVFAAHHTTEQLCEGLLLIMTM